MSVSSAPRIQPEGSGPCGVFDTIDKQQAWRNDRRFIRYLSPPVSSVDGASPQ